MRVIENYWADRGVKVVTNTLGANRALRNTYINQFSVLLDHYNNKQSKDIKLSCYRKLFPIESRTKLTGFEEISKLDQRFRNNIVKVDIDWPDREEFTPFSISSYENDYLSELVEFLRSVHNPLLYLSGGIDSELVALAMHNAGINFKVVIFSWTDKSGKILNGEDTKYAIKFCQQRGIDPIYKKLDIETLWTSDEFINLARELGLNSPQLTTHAYIVKLMKDELPDVTHLFGGEVRFEYITHQNKIWNVSYLSKLASIPTSNFDTTFITNNASLPSFLGDSRGVSKNIDNGDPTGPQYGRTYSFYIFSGMGWYATDPAWLTNYPSGVTPAYTFTVSNVTKTDSIISGWAPPGGGSLIREYELNPSLSTPVTIPNTGPNYGVPTAGANIWGVGLKLPVAPVTPGISWVQHVVNFYVTGGSGGTYPFPAQVPGSFTLYYGIEVQS